MKNFELKMKQLFIEESTQLLKDTERAFLTLEKRSENKAILEEIFRLTHNLKETAKAVGFIEIAKFTHEMEVLIFKIKDGIVPIVNDVISLLLECNDQLIMMVQSLDKNMNSKFDYSSKITKIKMAVELDYTQVTEDDLKSVQESEKITVPTKKASKKLKDLNNKTSKETEGLSLNNTPKLDSKTKESLSHPVESQRANLSKIDKLDSFVGELVILQSTLEDMNGSKIRDPIAIKSINKLSRITKSIQDISTKLRMTSLRNTFTKMNRIVRDTSNSLNKKVSLHLEGEETEIDKKILEHITDTLSHIIRNAIDHGIEDTSQRIAANKEEMAKITIKAFHDKSNFCIEVQDDGKGIDREKILKKAILKKIIKENNHLSDDEILNLIFYPGFTTSSEVSEISGRGVGLDIVKTNIDKLSGKIKITSKYGEGTLFKISLPLCTTIIEGLIISIGEQRFIIPLSQVQETIEFKKENIIHANGVGDQINHKGEYYKVHSLGKKLSIMEESVNRDDQVAIIIQSEEAKLAILVDDIVTHKQMVIKKPSDKLGNGQGIVGSSIVENGLPVFILDLLEIFSNQNSINQNAA